MFHVPWPFELLEELTANAIKKHNETDKILEILFITMIFS